MANPTKKTLSKNLSQMKFMKRRSRDPNDKDEVDSVAGGLVEKWIVPNVMPPTNKSTEVKQVDGFVECEDLNRFGRFSFNKFNKEIERLSQQLARGEETLDDKEEEEDGTISPLEVARRYEEITSKKLLGKRRRDDSGPSTGGRYDLLEQRANRQSVGFLKPS